MRAVLVAVGLVGVGCGGQDQPAQKGPGCGFHDTVLGDTPLDAGANLPECDGLPAPTEMTGATCLQLCASAYGPPLKSPDSPMPTHITCDVTPTCLRSGSVVGRATHCIWDCE